MKVFDEIFSAQIVLAKHFFAPIHYLRSFRNALLPLPSTCAVDLDLVEILVLLLPFTILVRIGGKVLVEVMVGVKLSIVAARRREMRLLELNQEVMKYYFTLPSDTIPLEYLLRKSNLKFEMWVFEIFFLRKIS